MKTTTWLLAALVSTIFLIQCKKDKTPPASDPEKLGAETGKILHYSFNGSLRDGSGNSLNGADSLNITYTTDRFGRANQAAFFGGVSNPSYILTPSLGSKISGFPFAVSLWFKAVSVNLYQPLIKADGFERSVESGFRLSLGARPGQIGIGFADKTTGGSTGTNYAVSPQNVLTPNTWYHIAVNVKGANDYDFYLNGTKITNCTYGGNATTIAFYPAPVRGIMGNDDGCSCYFNGAMDDYRIYTRILTEQEVQGLYNFHP